MSPSAATRVQAAVDRRAALKPYRTGVATSRRQCHHTEIGPWARLVTHGAVSRLRSISWVQRVSNALGGTTVHAVTSRATTQHDGSSQSPGRGGTKGPRPGAGGQRRPTNGARARERPHSRPADRQPGHRRVGQSPCRPATDPRGTTAAGAALRHGAFEAARITVGTNHPPLSGDRRRLCDAGPMESHRGGLRHHGDANKGGKQHLT